MYVVILPATHLHNAKHHDEAHNLGRHLVVAFDLPSSEVSV